MLYLYLSANCFRYDDFAMLFFMPVKCAVIVCCY